MRARPFSLESDDEGPLERALAAAVDLVRAELVNTDGGPWAAAALYVWDQGPALLPATMGLCSTDARQRALRESDPQRRESYAWVPAEWGALGEFELEYDEETSETNERLAESLDDESGEVPMWIAEEMCRRLTATSLQGVASDFVIYPFVGAGGGMVLSNIEDLAPAPAHAALVAAGLLPSPSGPAMNGQAGTHVVDPLVDDLVEAVVERLEAVLRSRGADGPWPAMAVRVRNDGGVLPKSVKLCPPIRRAEALTHRVPGARAMEIRERLETAWVDDWWHPTSGEPDDDGWGDAIETPLDWSAVDEARGQQAKSLLTDASENGPAGWLVDEACRRLNRRRPAQTTPDFVAYAHDENGGMAYEIAGSVLRVGTPEAIAGLVDAGILLDSLEKIQRLC